MTTTSQVRIGVELFLAVLNALQVIAPAVARTIRALVGAVRVGSIDEVAETLRRQATLLDYALEAYDDVDRQTFVRDDRTLNGLRKLAELAERIRVRAEADTADHLDAVSLDEARKAAQDAHNLKNG